LEDNDDHPEIFENEEPLLVNEMTNKIANIIPETQPQTTGQK